MHVHIGSLHVAAPTKPKRPLPKHRITLKPSAANGICVCAYLPHIWVYFAYTVYIYCQNSAILCVSYKESLALEKCKTRAKPKINENHKNQENQTYAEQISLSPNVTWKK